MIKRYPSFRRRPDPRDRFNVIVNHQINAPQLRVLDERGETLGIMSKSAALAKAQEQEKDLVLITDKADPPIAKIIDLSKHKYQLSQKKAQDRKKSAVADTKEIRLTPFIGDNDLQSKIRRITEFLKKGHKVRLSMEFRGRSITHKDLGEAIFNQVIDQTSELSTIEIPVKLMGKKMMTQLMPTKKTKGT